MYICHDSRIILSFYKLGENFRSGGDPKIFSVLLGGGGGLCLQNVTILWGGTC